MDFFFLKSETMKEMSKLLICCIILLGKLQAQTLQLEPNWWHPNGEVQALEKDTINNRIYIGGTFTALEQPNTSNGMALDTLMGMSLSAYAMPNSMVNTVLSDGNGGWFIGGNFSKVGDSTRYRIAHLTKDGKVSSLFRNAGFDGEINTLMRMGNTLYAGGLFNKCDSITLMKKNGAVFNNADDRPYNWPEPNGEIYTSVPDGMGGWYIGGYFTMVGDTVLGAIWLILTAME